MNGATHRYLLDTEELAYRSRLVGLVKAAIKDDPIWERENRNGDEGRRTVACRLVFAKWAAEVGEINEGQ